jgi:hypothetical protein
MGGFGTIKRGKKGRRGKKKEKDSQLSDSLHSGKMMSQFLCYHVAYHSSTIISETAF